VSRYRLTRWGLWANGIGGGLLLFFHFPTPVPSGDPVLTVDRVPALWWWVNLVGSLLGFLFIIVGSVWQSWAARPVPSYPPSPPDLP